ncbi:MBL fold metallo-hydrolase [Bacteroidota bacterium]
MKLFFVGTGSGKTSVTKFHSSILISSLGTNLLIDAGDGISKALLSHRIEYNLIDGIFITHLHADHAAGLPSFITQMKMNERKNNLSIYADPDLLKILKSFAHNSYLFPEKLGFIIDFIPVFQNVRFDLNENFKILSRQNSHLDSAKIFCKTDQSLSSSSLLITAESKNIHYTSDIGSNEDLKLFQDHEIDLLISELTHIEPSGLMEYFKLYPNFEKIIFTHIDEQYLVPQKDIFEGFSVEIREKTMLAYDGLEINL